MKFQKRATLIVTSAILAMATLTTWFTGCTKQEDTSSNIAEEVSTDNENNFVPVDYDTLAVGYQIITPDNYDDYSDIDVGQYDKDPNTYNSFAYQPDADIIKTIKETATVVEGATYLGRNQVYKDEVKSKEQGKNVYFIIDGDEALTVELQNNEYVIPESEFTDDSGNSVDSLNVYNEASSDAVAVFKNTTAYTNFFNTVKQQADTKSKPFVLNGTTLGNDFTPREQSTLAGTQNFYDINIIVQTFNAFSRTNPQRYGVMEIVKIDKDNGTITISRRKGAKEITETIPCSDGKNLFLYTGELAILDASKGEVNKGKLYPCPVIDGDTCYVAGSILAEIFGIDIVDGEYYFYPTNTYLPAYLGTTFGTYFEIKAQGDTPATTTPSSLTGTTTTTTTPAQTTTTKQTTPVTTKQTTTTTKQTTTTTKQTTTTTKQTTNNNNSSNNNSNNNNSNNSNNNNSNNNNSTQPVQTQPPVTEPPVTDPPQTQPPVTEPPVTDPPATEPPQTEPPAQDNNDYSDGTLTDGHGNTYPERGYVPFGEVVFKIGQTGSEDAQNYAAAVEAYYGIPMSVSGNAVYPTCFEDSDLIWDDPDALNAWRQGRSPAEIGPAEIVANWKLLGSDIGFYYECQNYLVNDLQLQFEFADGGSWS